MKALDQIAEPHRSIIIRVLREKDPILLTELWRTSEPDREQWDAVTCTLNDAASEHWIAGTDYEMDAEGHAINYAMGAFINAFMYVMDRDRPGTDLER